MSRNILFTILCTILVLAVNSQPIGMSREQRILQQSYIKQDTLPVIVEALPNHINSHFSEYAGNLYSDSTFLFTSMRADVGEDLDHFFETSWYCKIYESKFLGNEEYSVPVALPGVINNLSTFNSNYFYDEREQKLTYSRCKRVGDGELRCELWQSSRNSKGWSKPQRLPSSINIEGSSSMQPYFVRADGHQVLYYVSNRPDGIGGYDIWYSILKDGKYGTPVNLGRTINTEGNEVTPYYDTARNILYFSSDEHLGIGDYDIFYSEGSLNQWGEVSNMGIPFNSEYNDYYYTMIAGTQSGYFSSNRPHDEASIEDTCCNDLFKFRWNIVADTASKPEEKDSVTWSDRIASVLPITLYFQNDTPDPHSTSDTTEADYATLYFKYIKDAEQYISETSRGLTAEERAKATAEMAAFIQDSVQTSYMRLLVLEQYLKEALLSGEEISLTISGYASPLHNSSYNQHLSARRIVSLLNYFRNSDKAKDFFIPYIEGVRKGLTIHRDPQGEVLHAFQSNEKRETVYGVQAAKDRKIVISAAIRQEAHPH